MLLAISSQKIIRRPITRESDGLAAGAEAGGVNVGVFGFEAVETPDEGEFEVAGHASHFHPIVLAGMVNRHGR